MKLESVAFCAFFADFIMTAPGIDERYCIR